MDPGQGSLHERGGGWIGGVQLASVDAQWASLNKMRREGAAGGGEFASKTGSGKEAEAFRFFPRVGDPPSSIWSMWAFNTRADGDLPLQAFHLCAPLGRSKGYHQDFLC